MLLCCLVVFVALPLQAQLPTGSVAGVVKDQSEAVIPGAKVTLTNTSNGFTYTATTNNIGAYTVVNLAPATYTLNVEAKGFRNYEQQGITLVVNQIATENVVLQVGAATQTVEVTGAPPLLAAQDAELGRLLRVVKF